MRRNELPEYYQPEPFMVPDPTLDGSSTYRTQTGTAEDGEKACSGRGLLQGPAWPRRVPSPASQQVFVDVLAHARPLLQRVQCVLCAACLKALSWQFRGLGHSLESERLHSDKKRSVSGSYERYQVNRPCALCCYWVLLRIESLQKLCKARQIA